MPIALKPGTRVAIKALAPDHFLCFQDRVDQHTQQVIVAHDYLEAAQAYAAAANVTKGRVFVSMGWGYIWCLEVATWRSLVVDEVDVTKSIRRDNRKAIMARVNK